MEKGKPFCFQNIKVNTKAETPSACQCRCINFLLVWRKLLGQFRKLLCEIRINIKCWYERPGWSLGSTHTVLWAVVDVISSARHLSTCIFLLALHWAHGSFALHYSQVDADIIKANPWSIVGCYSQRKVTFPRNHNSMSIEYQITWGLGNY